MIGNDKDLSSFNIFTFMTAMGVTSSLGIGGVYYYSQLTSAHRERHRISSVEAVLTKIPNFRDIFTGILFLDTGYDE